MILGRRKEAAREQREKVLLYKRVFSTRDGKEVLFDLINRNHVLNTHEGSEFKEGRRAAVLDILSFCHINLAELDKLLTDEESA